VALALVWSSPGPYTGVQPHRHGLLAADFIAVEEDPRKLVCRRDVFSPIATVNPCSAGWPLCRMANFPSIWLFYLYGVGIGGRTPPPARSIQCVAVVQATLRVRARLAAGQVALWSGRCGWPTPTARARL